jgi:hypothetical protein
MMNDHRGTEDIIWEYAGYVVREDPSSFTSIEDAVDFIRLTLKRCVSIRVDYLSISSLSIRNRTALFREIDPLADANDLFRLAVLDEMQSLLENPTDRADGE